MLDIAQHSTDSPYLGAFIKRLEDGSPNALDRANAALGRADQAAAVFSETPDDLDKQRIKSHHDRVALAARACGMATREGEDDMATEFARVAESEALALDSFDYARLDGLRRPEALKA